ncbi:MAG: MBL fold metallo-hydrolase [Pseudomonadales bacterium]
MQCRVDEIAPDIFRLSTFRDDMGMQFNQFLVVDDEPMLIHTGFRTMFDTTIEGVRQIIDPATLRWIGYSHFEADECGALNEWLEQAPAAQPLCGVVGAIVNLADYADRPPRVLEDDATMTIGRHRLRYLATPHVPHGWDAGMYLDETGQTLFCSDLFFQPGDPGPLGDRSLVDEARAAVLAGRESPLAHDVPYTAQTRTTLERLAGLRPTTLAIMHGSSLRGDGSAALLALADIYEEVLGGHRPGLAAGG